MGGGKMPENKTIAKTKKGSFLGSRKALGEKLLSGGNSLKDF